MSATDALAHALGTAPLGRVAAVGVEGAWLARLGVPYVVSTFKPAADRLRQAGHTPHPALDGLFDTVVLYPSRDKEALKAQVADAWAHLQPGGTLWAALGNDEGGRSLPDLLAPLGDTASFSKARARAVAVVKTAIAAPADWALKPHTVTDGPDRYTTHPGLFSWREVDDGSRLLATHLPPLKGPVADVGCGWGYLSVQAVRKGATTLTLFEAESQALAAAQTNLAALCPGVPVTAHWADATADLPPRAFATVLANPPFHTPHDTDVAMGQSFVRACWRAVAPGGRLWLVANRTLPYEALLRADGGRVNVRAETGRFKVIEVTA